MNMTEVEAEALQQQIDEVKSTLKRLEEQDEFTDGMRQLKSDLNELLELNEQRLLEVKKSMLLSVVQDLDEANAAQAEASVNETLNESLIGQRCSVPHWSANGVLHRQNAVICGVEPSRGRVRVLIAAPTRPCDLPCRHFLEGDEEAECGPTGAACRRSHGIAVEVEQLGEYCEPDWTKLSHAALCLVKLPGRQLWHHARVEAVDETSRSVTVDLVHATDSEGQKVVSVAIENLLPLHLDGEEEEEESEVESHNSVSEEEEEEEAPRALADDRVAGPAWEAHTLGFGSRLMASMGYVPGSGLGARGQGRAEPVPIEVLPAGASLDRVMKLRERRRAREDARLGKAVVAGGPPAKRKATAERGMFAFMNRSLSANAAVSKRAAVTHKSLQESSGEAVGRRLLGAEKEVELLEARVARLKATLGRVGNHQPTQAELRRLEAELEKARAQVRLIERHKAQTHDKRKLRVF